jgi:NB-ARC domain
MRSVAVFVGLHGIGRWQQQEIDLAIAENTKRGMPVIPVWLADAPEDSELPHFLENFTWVNFRQTRLDPFERLVQGIPLEPQPTIAKPEQTGLKFGAPDPRVRLPENFVDRPDAINAVKSLLLTEEKTVVVSAIAGLGGLGKSVLATALVMDEEVRQRFGDDILWVTLGQNPDLLAKVGDWIRELDKSREKSGCCDRFCQTDHARCSEIRG